jgi:hypothetical protein
MNRFEQAFYPLDETIKKHLPVSYNFLYKFNKRGIVKKKGDAYYGIRVAVLNTSKFYPWGHTKPISKMIDYTGIQLKKKKSEQHEK